MYSLCVCSSRTNHQTQILFWLLFWQNSADEKQTKILHIFAFVYFWLFWILNEMKCGKTPNYSKHFELIHFILCEALSFWRYSIFLKFEFCIACSYVPQGIRQKLIVILWIIPHRVTSLLKQHQQARALEFRFDFSESFFRREVGDLTL